MDTPRVETLIADLNARVEERHQATARRLDERDEATARRLDRQQRTTWSVIGLLVTVILATSYPIGRLLWTISADFGAMRLTVERIADMEAQLLQKLDEHLGDKDIHHYLRQRVEGMEKSMQRFPSEQDP